MTRRKTPPELMRRPNPAGGGLLLGGLLLAALAGVGAMVIFKKDEPAEGEKTGAPSTDEASPGRSRPVTNKLKIETNGGRPGPHAAYKTALRPFARSGHANRFQEETFPHACTH